MTESPEYPLRWRGRQFGPYTIQEINRKLDEHEIGMGHEIHYQNKWISVEEFLLALKSATAAPGGVKRLRFSQPSASPSQGGPSVAASASAPRRLTPASPPPDGTKASAPLDEAEVRPELAAKRPRHRLVYAMLAIVTGYLGLHNFYARHWLTGLFQFLLSLATLLLGFGIIATWVWALVEAVVIRKDGYGTEMR